jgi:undecaprenyl-diphosphatase
LIPGTSRSLATILGGRLAGLSHAAATEFSFLVGLLTLSAASVYKMWSLGPALTQVYPAGPASVGLLVAAFTAFISVKWLVGYVSRNGLGVFAWYRIALGGAILAFLALK